MVASKVAVVLVILLLVTNTSAPRHDRYQITEKNCKALLSALFTGAILSDGHGNLLVDPLIMEILANYSNCKKKMEQRIRADRERTYSYRPKLTAAYATNNHGEIMGVNFSGGLDAEQKLLQNFLNLLDKLSKMGISFSSCKQCVDKFQELVPHARHIVIQIASVYTPYRAGIRRLVQLGYPLEPWNTTLVLDFLFHQDELSQEIKDALWRTLTSYYGYFGYGHCDYYIPGYHGYLAYQGQGYDHYGICGYNGYTALLERDFTTWLNITDILRQENEEEEELVPIYLNCRENLRQNRDDDNDDDDQPGAERATGRRGGGRGGGIAYISGSSCSSSGNNRRARQGTTTQHSSGWYFSTIGLATVHVVAFLWSTYYCLNRSFKERSRKLHVHRKDAVEDPEVSEHADEDHKNDWERLVCAMFTGAILSDGNGGLLVFGEIKGILKKYHSNPDSLGRTGYYYFPILTTLHSEYSEGFIIGVEAEKYRNIAPEGLRSIGMNYSPRKNSVDKIIATFGSSKPVIHFSWVRGHPKYRLSKEDSLIGIRCLLKSGFTLQVWKTKDIMKHLLQQAPSEELKDSLRRAYENTKDALSQRDETTQEIIAEMKM